MCLKFAEMERRLGEIDRARAIYGHASQFCDPRTNAPFWQKWELFEVNHGNDDTFGEMIRIKRSVQAQYKYVIPTAIKLITDFLTFSTAPTSTSLHRKPLPGANSNPRQASKAKATMINAAQMPWRNWSVKLVLQLASWLPPAAQRAVTVLHLPAKSQLSPRPTPTLLILTWTMNRGRT